MIFVGFKRMLKKIDKIVENPQEASEWDDEGTESLEGSQIYTLATIDEEKEK
jgi:hypothetical protein